jgi:hypothetical protein
MRRWLCRIGFHDYKIIAYCDLPDSEDESKTCTTCAPLRQCQRCGKYFTW